MQILWAVALWARGAGQRLMKVTGVIVTVRVRGAALEGGWCEAPPYLARAAETLLEANLMRKEARHSRQTQPPESSYFSCLMFFSPVCKAAEGERHTTAQMES